MLNDQRTILLNGSIHSIALPELPEPPTGSSSVLLFLQEKEAVPPPRPVLKAFDPKTADTKAYDALRGEVAEVWDNRMTATLQTARQTELDEFIADVDRIRTIGNEKAMALFKTRFQAAFPEVDFTKPVRIRSSNATGEFVLTVESGGKQYTTTDRAVVRAEALYAFLLHAESTGGREGAPKGFAPAAVEALRLRLHERKEFEKKE